VGGGRPRQRLDGDAAHVRARGRDSALARPRRTTTSRTARTPERCCSPPRRLRLLRGALRSPRL
jgi:hypothetical protein